MRYGYMRQALCAVAAAATSTILTHAAPGTASPAAAPFNIHADFSSVLIPQGSADCPVADQNGPTGLLLVQGAGFGSGERLGNHAPGTAQECSLPVGLEFHVTGKGTYTAPDGSLVYLHYSEVSENPFTTAPGPPPGPQWTLHDTGTWTIDPVLSTGRFKGATGSGTIVAEVPIYLVGGQFVANVSADYVGTIVFAQGPK